MLCNKLLFCELLNCLDNDLENNFEHNVWKLQHNAEELQEILNRNNAMNCKYNYLSHTTGPGLCGTAFGDFT